MSTPTVHPPSLLILVVALPAEAKPLIEMWNLHLVRDRHGSRIYANQDGDISLIQCGVGRTAAALGVATAFFHHQESTSFAWLNVGIAGSADHPLGTTLIAQKIVDRGTQKCWYPPQIATRPAGLAPTTLVTVDHGESNYQPGETYDMEGSAFVDAATRYASSEVVQCIKVVSDSPNSHLDSITKEDIWRLMGDAVPVFSEYKKTLMELCDRLSMQQSSSPHLGEFLEVAHFTTTQEHQLKKALRRWHALRGDTSPFAGIAAKANAKTIIAHLNRTLDQAPMPFPRTT